ncbi:MAG: hypothetical protein B6241_04935 [Spirochaetaceae bacterium 4572_59]|nr:MAG: hypothetical protein B6241_04935 [Spirochaetaceae bacterium 4572_59]
MVAYLDSSVLLEHVLKGDSAIYHVFECDSVISSELLEIECKRVVHRYRLENILDDSGFLKAMDRIESIMKGLSLLRLSPKIKTRAAETFPLHVKPLDALHLSSALAYRDARPDESIILFSYDRGFNRCAKALGLPVPFFKE